MSFFDSNEVGTLSSRLQPLIAMQTTFLLLHCHSQVSFFDSNEVGTLTSRLQSDTQAMTKCVATNLNIATRNMLQAIGGCVGVLDVS